MRSRSHSGTDSNGVGETVTTELDKNYGAYTMQGAEGAGMTTADEKSGAGGGVAVEPPVFRTEGLTVFYGDFAAVR